MKALVPALALLLVVAFSLPAFAATSKSACQKAGGVWDAKSSKCVVRKELLLLIVTTTLTLACSIPLNRVPSS